MEDLPAGTQDVVTGEEYRTTRGDMKRNHRNRGRMRIQNIEKSKETQDCRGDWGGQADAGEVDGDTCR